ncbi:MAG: hypothetical protein K2M76_02210 [Muribaculaceae bacterium]|nr:hypothetical protein [Muribaculaceae bacterium]
MKFLNRFTAFMTLAFASTALSAQVAGPMKDVNQVIDNTLESLNKEETLRPVAGSSR